MRRKPRQLGEPLFGADMLQTGFIQGLGVLVVVLGVYAYMLLSGHGEEEARMLAFLNMVIADLALVFTNRSWTRNLWQLLFVPNKALWWVIAGASAFLALTLILPFLRGLLGFAELSIWEFGLLALTGMGIIAIAELAKPCHFRRRKAPRTGVPLIKSKGEEVEL